MGAGLGGTRIGGTRISGTGISVRGVSRAYRGAGQPVQALLDVDLDVGQGRFVSLIGPSGCGKSTLLRAVAGLEPVDAGSITVFGRTPAQAGRDKEVGLVPQAPALLPWLTVRANAALPSRVNRAADRRRAAATDGGGLPAGGDIEAVLAQVGLGDVLDRYPHELSGGMQQRVAVARAFGMRPRVLLMDEPFSAVDELTREGLRVQLLDLWAQARTTVLFVTHSVREAVLLSDAVVVMSPRPGRTSAVVEVDLPRPRDEAVLLSPERGPERGPELGPELAALEGRVRRALRVPTPPSVPVPPRDRP